MAGLATNLFAIGRKGEDENQLTALLGALFHHEPETLDRLLRALGLWLEADGEWELETESVHSQGRFDLLVQQPGVARFVIESKVNAGLASDQVARYLGELRPHKVARGLVVIARERTEFSLVDRTCAALHGIGLISLRWADLVEIVCPEGGDAGSLATDFKELLMSEGLATGPPVDDGVWDVLSAMPDALRRLESLVTVAAERLAGPFGSREGEVARAARLYHGRRVSADVRRGAYLIRIDLAASDGAKKIGGPPVLAIAVTKEGIGDAKQKRAWAERCSGKLAGTSAQSRWVRRPIAVSELTAPDLTGQAGLVVDRALALLDAVVASDNAGSTPPAS